MRRAMTPAELRIWLHLRNRALEGLRFRRQVPIGPFVVDFFCSERRLVVEVDGDHHGHDRQAIADANRTRVLQARGCRVLRVANGDVMSNIDGVCEAILAAAAEPLPKSPSAI
jgi:very-short-patch-repair endonuclease